MLCALGLSRALSPSVLGRLGSGALALAGIGSFLDGLFRLDCRGIDGACTNHTWHSHAHKLESGFTWVAFLGAWLLREPAAAPEAANPPPSEAATP